jgi:flagellar hook assembly protein FlgD
MKTLILTAALVVLTAVSFAQKDSKNGKEIKSDASSVKVAMFSNNCDRVTMIVMKQPEDKLNLKIKDENGSVVYEKKLRKPESRKIIFDIRSLPAGEYTFELAKDKEVLYSNAVSKDTYSLAFSN